MNDARITDASNKIYWLARRTPFLNSPLLDAAFGKRIFVKAESLQLTGSFKVRGAIAALQALPQGTGGVLAMSSGNHGQGVALVAARLGLQAVVLMPGDAPQIKIANTRAYGAEVVLYNRATDDRDTLALALCEERGLKLIRPFDDPDVIAGQGTVGVELDIDVEPHRVTSGDVIVCCGGGGLAAGIALALEHRRPDLTVRTAEPQGFDDMARSLTLGERQVNAATAGSVCDAILTPSPGTLTFPILQRLAGPGLVVTDEEAMRAMALAFTHFRLVLEPGGAVALAAALFRDTSPNVICIASGGNVDPAFFADVLARYA